MPSHMGYGAPIFASPHSTVRIRSVYRGRVYGLSPHSRFRYGMVSSWAGSSTMSLSAPGPFTFASVQVYTPAAFRFSWIPPFRVLSPPNVKSPLHKSLAPMKRDFAANPHDSRLAFLQLSTNQVAPDLTKECLQKRLHPLQPMTDSRLKRLPNCISASDANPCTRVAHHFRPPMDRTCWEEPLRKAPSRTIAEPEGGFHTQQRQVCPQGGLEASIFR